MKKPQDLGPLTHPFERRYGYDGLPSPGGVFTEGSPAACPPHKFLELQNVRWEGDGVVPRPGQALMNTGGVAIHHATAHIHPSQFNAGGSGGGGTPNQLFILGDGCPAESAGTGFFVGHFDPDQEPQIQRAVWYDNGPPTMVAIVFYGGTPYVIVDNQLRKYESINLDWGIENITVSGDSQDRPLVTLPAVCNAAIEFAGLLLMLCNDGSIQSWDGRTLRQDLAPVGADIPVAAGLFRDTLLIGYALAANKISVRTAAGAYTHIGGGVPTVRTKLGRNSIVSYKDNAYGASGSTTVWKFDGTTLTGNFKTLAGATIESVAEYGAYLFAGYGNAGAKLARYDNAAWVDTHKDFTLQAGLAAAVRAPGLLYYKDNLLAMLIMTALTTRLAWSPGAATSGTYEVHNQSGTLSNDVRYILTAAA